MMNDQTRRMVQAAAQFHDIADHKYVTDPASCGVEEELQKYFSAKASASLVKVMAAVSFSKERKLRVASGTPETPHAFESTLGPVGALLRDIVSDADKLEAIGSIGVQRCMAYKRESVREKENREATEAEVVAELIKHGEEKLFVLLAHRYIRTSAGRKMAEPAAGNARSGVRDDQRSSGGVRATAEDVRQGRCRENSASSSNLKRLVSTDASAAPIQSPVPSVAASDNKTPGTASATSKSLDVSTAAAALALMPKPARPPSLLRNAKWRTGMAAGCANQLSRTE